MGFLVGIDKGTTVIKSVVFDAAGRPRAAAQRPVEVLRPQRGWHEEDPERTWALTVETLREALAAAGIAGHEVKAVGLAGHMGGAWLVDGRGRALRNAICWPDGRAQALQLKLQEAGHLERIFEIGGNGLMPGITAMILRWLQEHEPALLRDCAHVLCAKDYLRLRLTGRVATEPSDVSFVPGDIRARGFSEELFALCGITSWLERMAPVVDSGAVAGEVTAAAAAETGLAAGTPVVAGLGDAAAAAVGAGAVTPGSAVTVLGTSCLNSLVLDRPALEPHGLGFLFAMPGGRYVRILPNTAGTMTMDWFVERFGAPRQADGRPDFTLLSQRAAAVPPGAGGVLLLPYLNDSGVLAPFFDTLARGAFFGVNAHTTHDHLLRAVYEGLCYATRDCFDAMPQRPARLTLTGGGARSPFWAQLFADICDLPVEVGAAEETGALGVALLAGVAAGFWPDLESAVAATAAVAARYSPDPRLTEIHAGWLGLYRELRDVYRGFSERRAALLPEVAA